ncbi:hypothetical protein [Streptomyces sp. NPDC001744]|uniref:hypothetical protein n=1 Tax=Streptomyces sp. NPDC001744 TaxID=3364606 RepID=UPI0036AA2FC2
MSDVMPEPGPVTDGGVTGPAGGGPAGRAPEEVPDGTPPRAPAEAPDESRAEAARAEPAGTADEPPEPAAAPLGIDREPTGHAAVDARLARLAEIDRLPADRHLEVYEDVHRGLRDELTSLDARPAPHPHENRS